MAHQMQRLKTRAQFKAVLGGELVAKSSHFALHRLELGAVFTAIFPDLPASLFTGDGVWLGAMVPKRCAKRAVTRNSIKRQIYTVSPSLMPHFAQAAYLVRLRREFSRKDFPAACSVVLNKAVRTELLVLMQGATRLGPSQTVAP